MLSRRWYQGIEMLTLALEYISAFQHVRRVKEELSNENDKENDNKLRLWLLDSNKNKI